MRPDRLNHHLSDHFHDYLEGFLDIEVGEVHDPPPERRQLPITQGLSFEVLMGGSIHLDDELGTDGSEIDNERSDRVLAAEVNAELVGLRRCHSSSSWVVMVRRMLRAFSRWMGSRRLLGCSCVMGWWSTGFGQLLQGVCWERTARKSWQHRNALSPRP